MNETNASVSQMIVDHPWMERHLRAFPVTLASYRKARQSNPSWRYLSKYGRLVAFIFGNVNYMPVQP